MLCDNCDFGGIKYCWHPQQWYKIILDNIEKCSFFKEGFNLRKINRENKSECSCCKKIYHIDFLNSFAKGKLICKKCIFLKKY